MEDIEPLRRVLRRCRRACGMLVDPFTSQPFRSELVKQKTTNPLVIAQCYHMGPAAKLDPLVMLAEAKRICDTLVSLISPFYPSQF